MTSLFPPESTNDELVAPNFLLPPYQSCLLQGKYHPSAPIHLAHSALLSQNGGEGSNLRRAVILTPSKQRFGDPIRDFRDDWIKNDANQGKFMKLFENALVLYPPTPSHLCLALAAFRVCPDTPPSPDNALELAWLNANTTFALPPALIILHEPSSYFLPSHANTDASDENTKGNNDHWTISSYLTIVTTAVSAASQLSSGSHGLSVPLVIFDSQLPEFKLPLVQPTRPPPSQAVTSGDRDRGEGTSREPSRPAPAPTVRAAKTKVKTELIAPFVAKYIEWIGTFELRDFDSAAAAALPQRNTHIRSLRLCKAAWMDTTTGAETPEENVEWKWGEVPATEGDENRGRPGRGVRFVVA